jgi:GT2 family glycosyltransferase
LLFGDPRVAGLTFMGMAPSHGEVTPESILAVDVGILTSAVVARKKPIFEVDLFDEAIRRGQDFDLWLRLAKHGVKFAYQRKVLLHHRIVESGLSGNIVSQLERTLTLLETIRKRGGLTSGEEAALSLNMNRTRAGLAMENGKGRLRKRDFAGAREFFNEARQVRPSLKLTIVCLSLRIAPELFWRVYRTRSTLAF